MEKFAQRFLLLLLAAFLSLTFVVATVSAAGEPQTDTQRWSGVTKDIEEAPGYEDAQDTEREWALSVGVTSGFTPDYEGSNDYSFGYGPNISASWRDTIFYKGKTLGINFIRGKLKAGPVLSWTSGRNEDDNEKLTGLGDVDSSIEAGGFVSYRKKPLRFRAEIRQDVNSGHEGALVELNGGATLPYEKLPVLIELGTTWASADYMKSFFGVDTEQSLASGLKRFNTDAGIKDVKITVTAGYAITNRWRIGGAFEYKRLVGDAADSPIVDDRNQCTVGLSLSYHMGSKLLPEDLQ